MSASHFVNSNNSFSNLLNSISLIRPMRLFPNNPMAYSAYKGSVRLMPTLCHSIIQRDYRSCLVRLYFGRFLHGSAPHGVEPCLGGLLSFHFR